MNQLHERKRLVDIAIFHYQRFGTTYTIRNDPNGQVMTCYVCGYSTRESEAIANLICNNCQIHHQDVPEIAKQPEPQPPSLGEAMANVVQEVQAKRERSQSKFVWFLFLLYTAAMFLVGYLLGAQRL